MSPLQLLILAIGAMGALAVMRVVRVQSGRSPHPDRRARYPFIAGFLLLPPIIAAALITPADGGPLRGITAVPLYLISIAGVALVMALLAVVVRGLVRGRSRRLLLIALIGREGDPEALPFDPPVTAQLAETVGVVNRANAAFPRGVAFATSIDRTGFRDDWDALDAATRTLEGEIATDNRLGLGVSDSIAATARDARGRLDTLRRLWLEHDRAWVG